MSTTAASHADVRGKLLALAGHSDPYLFLSCVGDYLAQVPDDDQVRATAMRLAVQKNLFSVAAEFAVACPTTSPGYAQLAALGQQFGSHIKDLLDWRGTDRRFAANLQALRGRREGSDLAERIEQAWAEMPPELTLHRASDGNLLVRGLRSDGLRIWIPAAQDFVNITEAIGDEVKFKGEFVSPFLICGAGVGRLIPELYARTSRTYLTYSPAIYLVETNLRALALALRLYDWSTAIADERFVLVAGPDAWDVWKQIVLGDPELPEPQQIVALTRWPGDQPVSPNDYLQQVKEHRSSTMLQIRGEVDALYAGRDAAFWARRFAQAGPTDPLRVLCLTSRHTTFLRHSTADLQAAFDRAGFATRLVVERADHTALNGAVCMAHFKEFQPDLVVVIDHHRHEMPDRFPADVPYLCWIQDELPRLYSVEAGRSLGPLDFTMGFGKGPCVALCDYPAERFMPCWLAVNPSKFAPAPDSVPDASLRCDVAYIGHHAETPAALHARIRGQLDPPITQYVDALFEEIMPLMRSPQPNGVRDLRGLMRTIERNTGIGLRDEKSRSRLLGVYVRPLVDRVMRHTTLEWVADWAESTGRRFHLYGRCWETHPRLGRFARGEARHGDHLGAIVRAAAINLHVGLNPALHQRVLETAVAGGFLLVQYHWHDFYPLWVLYLREFVLTNNVALPASIPYGALPEDIVVEHRRYLAIMDQPSTGHIEVAAQSLADYHPPQPIENRYPVAGEVFPMLERITFDSPQSFASQAERYLSHAEERARIAAEMKTIVEARFTYDALAAAAVGFVRTRLSAQVT